MPFVVVVDLIAVHVQYHGKPQAVTGKVEYNVIGIHTATGCKCGHILANVADRDDAGYGFLGCPESLLAIWILRLLFLVYRTGSRVCTKYRTEQ